MLSEAIFLTLFASACAHLGVSFERNKYRFAGKKWEYDTISTHTRAFLRGFFHPISSTTSLAKRYLK